MPTLSGASDTALSAPSSGAQGATGNASQLGLLQALLGLLGGGQGATAPGAGTSNTLGLLQALPPSSSTASPATGGFDPTSLGRFLGPLGRTVSQVGNLGNMPGVADVGSGITGLGGLFNIGAGAASGNPAQAAGGALQTLGPIARLFDLPALNAVTGPLSGILGLATGNPAQAISAIPGTLSGIGALADIPALASAGSLVAAPIAIAGGMIGNEMSQAANRERNIASEIRRGQRNVPVVMNQILQGAAGSSDPLTEYGNAMQAIAGSAQIADPFGKSGKTKSVSGPFGSGRDMKLPDYSQQIALFNQLMPSVMSNAIGGEQALAQGQNLAATLAPGTQGNVRPESYNPIAVQGQDVTLKTPEQFFDWAVPLWLNGAQAPQGLMTGETPYTTQYTPGQDQGALSMTDQPVYTATQTQWRPDVQADIAALDPKNLTVGLRDILTKYLGPSTSPFANLLGAG